AAGQAVLGAAPLPRPGAGWAAALPVAHGRGKEAPGSERAERPPEQAPAGRVRGAEPDDRRRVPRPLAPRLRPREGRRQDVRALRRDRPRPPRPGARPPPAPEAPAAPHPGVLLGCPSARPAGRPGRALGADRPPSPPRAP